MKFLTFIFLKLIIGTPPVNVLTFIIYKFRITVILQNWLVLLLWPKSTHLTVTIFHSRCKWWKKYPIIA